MTAPAPRVLVVEDDPIASALAARTLAQLGQPACCVSSGLDALRHARTETFAAALIDIDLGREPDGIETADWLHRLFAIPIIFVTASADAATMERAAAIAPANYLLKPVAAAQLRAALALVAAPGASAAAHPPPAVTDQERLALTRGQLARIVEAVDEVRMIEAMAQRPRTPLPAGLADLTAREWETIRDLLDTPSVHEVAARRNRSVHTINNHLKSIFRKLEVHSIADLLRLMLGASGH